jgi:hypothetical protein
LAESLEMSMWVMYDECFFNALNRSLILPHS